MNGEAAEDSQQNCSRHRTLRGVPQRVGHVGLATSVRDVDGIEEEFLVGVGVQVELGLCSVGKHDEPDLVAIRCFG